MEQFRCNHCNKRLLDYDFKGKVVVKCPRCGKVNKLERF